MNSTIECTKISIVIAVYNSEKYLNACVLSVLKQKHQNLEIFLIDDGSTDRSGDICDFFAQHDDRVKTFHIENGGVSKARNFALNLCTGEYVGFIDSDDTIEENMYSNMLLLSNNQTIDIIQCGYKKIGQNNKTKEYDMFDEKIENNAMIERLLFFPDKKISNSVCTKLFSRKIYTKIRFDENLRIGEDLKFVLEACSISESIRLISGTHYKYFERSQSAMTSRFSEKRMDDFIVNDWCLKRYNNPTMQKLIRTRDAECCVANYFLSTKVFGKKNDYKQIIRTRLKNDRPRFRLTKRYELSAFTIVKIPFIFDFYIKLISIFKKS